MSEPRELKMWLAVRQDIKMSKGKLAAQSGHAFGDLYLKARDQVPDLFRQYQEHATPKVTVKAKNADTMDRIAAECLTAGICYEWVRDAGRSELEPGTLTVIAFGPAYLDELPKFLQRLQVLKDDKEEAPAAAQ